MKALRAIRLVLILFGAVLLPLEQAHCALMPQHAPVVGVDADHHDGDDHDCCPDPPQAPGPASPTDPCCCACLQLPAAPAPASVSLVAPGSVLVRVADLPAFAPALGASSVFRGMVPDARSGSPPGPSAAPQSPRSPPYSA